MIRNFFVSSTEVADLVAGKRRHKVFTGDWHMEDVGLIRFWELVDNEATGVGVVCKVLFQETVPISATITVCAVSVSAIEQLHLPKSVAKAAVANEIQGMSYDTVDHPCDVTPDQKHVPSVNGQICIKCGLNMTS
jgi:hypothetical protein